MNFTRRDFLKTSLIIGGVVITSTPLPLTLALSPVRREEGEENVYAAREEFAGPLPHIEVGGLIRPPGALPENKFKAKCTSCGACVNVCHVMKYDAIALLGLKLPTPPYLIKSMWMRVLNSNTPYIKDMRDFPCALCMECPKHCPTGALQKVEKEDVKMGMALIDFGLCFGWNGDICLSCAKACPMGAKIFEFYHGEWGNQPYINDNCVGCGLCVKYCPLGGSAIKIITREQYERIKIDYIKGFKRLLSMSNEERYNIIYSENLPNIMARGRLIEREYR